MSATLAAEGANALGALVCPECGNEAGTARALYRPRRKTKLAWLGVAVVLLGLCGQAAPRVLRVGPLGSVPTTVLIAGVGWLPMDWLEGARPTKGSLQSRWLTERATAELAHAGDPRRLAFLLRHAITGDVDAASETITRMCQLVLNSGNGAWSACLR